MLRDRYFCRIDRHGCVNCGTSVFDTKPVINDLLSTTWELTPSDRTRFDEREGHQCVCCGMSKRVRMLSWSIRTLFPSLSGLAVLHLNQVNHLSDSLRDAALLVETCFDQSEAWGEVLRGLVNQNMNSLTFPDQFFDLVIHSETLEHLHDYSGALNEAARVLKPGGVQVYTVPLLHRRRTRRRILLQEGQEVFCLPLSCHGEPGEYPVVWEFGGDFLKKRRGKIFQIHYDDYWKNPTVFTLVERKAIA
jgi:SAM-dependent methyltransferase